MGETLKLSLWLRSIVPIVPKGAIKVRLPTVPIILGVRTERPYMHAAASCEFLVSAVANGAPVFRGRSSAPTRDADRR
jgi:hypothetical protein